MKIMEKKNEKDVVYRSNIVQHQHSKMFYIINIILLFVFIPGSIFLIGICIYSFVFDFEWIFFWIFILLIIGDIVVFTDLFRKNKSDQMTIYNDRFEVKNNTPFPFNKKQIQIIPFNKINRIYQTNETNVNIMVNRIERKWYQMKLNVIIYETRSRNEEALDEIQKLIPHIDKIARENNIKFIKYTK